MLRNLFWYSFHEIEAESKSSKFLLSAPVIDCDHLASVKNISKSDYISVNDVNSESVLELKDGCQIAAASAKNE